MERLTREDWKKSNSMMWRKVDDLQIKENEKKSIKDVLKKLAEYEDLEEQGKLLKLPCKVGDVVYTACSWGIEKGTVGSIEIMQDRIFVNNIHGEMIGESGNIFLTEKEAEKHWRN